MSVEKIEPKTTRFFNEAVKLYAVRQGNDKHLERLLDNFNITQVAKLIQLFSCEWIHIPNKQDIIKMYRNKRIREELDAIDPNDHRAIRERKSELASFFGVSFSRVSAVYSQEKERFPGNFDAVDAIANRIYKEEFAKFQIEMEAVLGCSEREKDTQTHPPVLDY